MKCRGKVCSLEAEHLGVFCNYGDLVKVGIALDGNFGHVTVRLRRAAARAYLMGRVVDVEIRPRW